MGQRVQIALPPNIQFGIQGIVLNLGGMRILYQGILGNQYLALRVHCLVQTILVGMVMLMEMEIFKFTQRAALVNKVLRSL